MFVHTNNNVLFVKCSVDVSEVGISLILNKTIEDNKKFKLEIKDLLIPKGVFLPVSVKMGDDLIDVLTHTGLPMRGDSLRRYFIENSYYKKIVLTCYHGFDQRRHILVYNKMRKSEVLK